MKKILLGLIVGFVLGISISTAIAVITKYESTSSDAQSIVAYGTKDAGTTITRVKVEADGTLCIQ